MSKSRQVGEKASAVLLGTAARLVSQGRSFDAPSAERETLAEVVADALRLDVIPSEKFTRDIDALRSRLEAFLDVRGEPCEGEPGVETSIATVALVTAIYVAADLATARFLIDEATKSKGFQRRIDRHLNEPRPILERFRAALTHPEVQASLRSADDLEEAEVASLASMLDLAVTRQLWQQHVSNRRASKPKPISGDPVSPRKSDKPQRPGPVGPAAQVEKTEPPRAKAKIDTVDRSNASPTDDTDPFTRLRRQVANNLGR